MTTLQWENLNSHRRYPLVDNVNYRIDRVGDSGASPYEFRDDILLDCIFTTYIHADPVITLARILIEQVLPAPPTCRLEFRINNAEFINVDIPYNSNFPLSIDRVISDPLSTAPRYNFHCLIGDGLQKLLDSWPTGIFYFTPHPSILPSQLTVLDKHRVLAVRGSYVPPGAVTSHYLTQTIYLEEGFNTAIVLSPLTNTITINCQQGAGAGVSCDILDNARKPEDGIISINDVLPNMTGNISLIAGAGIVIDKFDDHTLRVKTTIDDNLINCFKQLET